MNWSGAPNTTRARQTGHRHQKEESSSYSVWMPGVLSAIFADPDSGKKETAAPEE